MTQVDFYYSLGSRYSYLAATQIDALEEETGCRVVWQPLNGVTLAMRRGPNPFEGTPISIQYEWSYREEDAQRWAALYGVPYVEPHGRVAYDSQEIALASVAAQRLGHVRAYSEALFSAIFVEPDLDRIDRAECIRRAEGCGIAAARFEAELDSAETAAALSAAVEKAYTLGVPGIPTFVVDHQLFWGNDRLILLRHYLNSR